jgi:hypothetical protein
VARRIGRPLPEATPHQAVAAGFVPTAGSPERWLVGAPDPGR